MLASVAAWPRWRRANVVVLETLCSFHPMRLVVINRRVATLIEIQAIAERRAAVACGCAMRVPERRRVVLYTSSLLQLYGFLGMRPEDPG